MYKEDMSFITPTIYILYIGRFMIKLFPVNYESIKMRKLRCSGCVGFFYYLKKAYENNTEYHFLQISCGV